MLVSLTLLKIIIAGGIFIAGIISTLVPLCIKDTNVVLFSLGNMMASGVLLAAGLVHQLADGSDKFSGYSFPWAEFICGSTFIAFLIFEEAIHICWGRVHVHGVSGRSMSPSSKSDLRHHSHDDENDDDDHCCGDLHHSHKNTRQIHLLSSDHDSAKHNDRIHPSFSGHSNREPLIVPPTKNIRCSSVSYQDGDDAVFSDLIVNRENNHETRTDVAHAESHHHHKDHLSQHLHGSFVASVVLLIALSVHSILAGLSIGFRNNIESITSTTSAIMAHKMFAGYALGSAMVAANVNKWRHTTFGATFACSTPIGILVGMLSRDFLSSSHLLTGTITSMVAGTFLYISIIEIGIKELLVCREREQQPHALSLTVKQTESLKLLFLVIGFSFMSVLAIWV